MCMLTIFLELQFQSSRHEEKTKRFCVICLLSITRKLWLVFLSKEDVSRENTRNCCASELSMNKEKRYKKKNSCHSSSTLCLSLMWVFWLQLTHTHFKAVTGLKRSCPVSQPMRSGDIIVRWCSDVILAIVPTRRCPMAGCQSSALGEEPEIITGFKKCDLRPWI